MSTKQYTAKLNIISSWIHQHGARSVARSAFPCGLKIPRVPTANADAGSPHQIPHLSFSKLAPLSPVRNWLNNLEISDRKVAHKLCHTIPTQCPFEREIRLLGRTIAKIPPLCKLNPLYNEIVALRFRAICYLADECGEDVSAYC